MNITEVEKLLGQTVDTLKKQAEGVDTGLVHLMATLQTLKQAQSVLANAEQNATGPDPAQEAADENLQQERDAVQEMVNQCHELAHQLGQLVTQVVPRNLHSICQVASLPPHTAWVDAPAYTLLLKEVASWQLRHLAQSFPGKQPSIIAALPSLQRGAVWRPNQVELLWDSILRGFPIGSLVVSRQLDRQISRAGAVAGTTQVWQPREITHHLLDGQQRCNAIALGYHDPFATGGKPSEVRTILWLDLQPTAFASGSSRSFMVRVTTQAHPWGYGVEDRVTKLGVADVRRALDVPAKKEGSYDWHPQVGGNTRPVPCEIWPLKAQYPLPMAWLIQAAEASSSATLLWDEVLKLCDQHVAIHTISNPHHWAQRAATFLRSKPDNLDDLAHALLRLKRLRMVALNVPTEALVRATRHEGDGYKPQADESITNVEHLFGRLNGGGTQLSPDELQYSMIKAYWPGIERIEEIKTRPSATQIALLGARTAMSDVEATPPEPAPALTVSTLRSLAVADKSQKSAQNDKLFVRAQAIRQMFGLNTAPQLTIASTEVAKIIKRVDEWLLYDFNKDLIGPPKNPNGLPPVLRSRMADQTPDLYYFLMCLARLSIDRGIQPTPQTVTRLRGLTTALHWFGLDRGAAMKKVWSLGPLENWLNGSVYKTHPHIITELFDLKPKKGVLNLQTPQDLTALITVPQANANPKAVAEWDWETLIGALVIDPKTGQPDPDKLTTERAKYRPLIDNLIKNKLLLIYAQRDAMDHLFNTFDPSTVGYWEDHNRPWDEDHILPQSNFHDLRKHHEYMEFCQKWGRTIGNLHMWPFEKNRSRQNVLANATVDFNNPTFLKEALLDQPQPDMRDAFSIERKHLGAAVDSQPKVLAFAEASRARLLRIYTDWFTSMDIGSML
jgi:hypothetical protein